MSFRQNEKITNLISNINPDTVTNLKMKRFKNTIKTNEAALKDKWASLNDEQNSGSPLQYSVTSRNNEFTNDKKSS